MAKMKLKLNYTFIAINDLPEIVAKVTADKAFNPELDRVLLSLGYDVGQYDTQVHDKQKHYHVKGWPGWLPSRPSPLMSVDHALVLTNKLFPDLDPLVYRSGRTWIAELRTPGEIAVGGKHTGTTPALALVHTMTHAVLARLNTAEKYDTHKEFVELVHRNWPTEEVPDEVTLTPRETLALRDLLRSLEKLPETGLQSVAQKVGLTQPPQSAPPADPIDSKHE